MSTMSVDSAPPPHVQRWRRTWDDFLQALYNPNEPFDSWIWIYRLGVALSDYLSHVLHLDQAIVKAKEWVRPAIPLSGFCVILFLLYGYFSSLKVNMVRKRWCGDLETICTAETVHSALVAYLAGMVLYHYTTVTFRSPGVALASQNQDQRWLARDGRGGMGLACLMVNPTCNPEKEHQLVKLYGDCTVNDQDQHQQDDDHNTFPTTTPSYCDKCNIWRPPRCHHCSSCNRCILQMDHHCPWINNCVGLNNHRTFFVFIFFLVTLCGYGMALSGKAFYELIKHQIDEHGWQILYQQMTGFLDLPTPWNIMYMLLSTGALPWDVWVKILYPILFFVGILLGSFCCFHVYYITTAQTTLEHRIILSRMKQDATRTLQEQAVHRSSDNQQQIHRPHNPYDQKHWWQNIKQVLGPNLWLLLLPITPDSPPPYLPPKSKSS